MEPSKLDNLIYESANYEDWNVLSYERRNSLGMPWLMKTQAQLQYILDDESEELIGDVDSNIS